MQTASKKAKARRLQSTVRDWILEKWKVLTCDDVRSTPMGVQGVDVQLSAKAKQLFPYAVECKNIKRAAVYGYYKQAQDHGEREGGEPVVFIKANHKQPLAIVDAQHFMELVGKNAPKRQNRRR